MKYALLFFACISMHVSITTFSMDHDDEPLTHLYIAAWAVGQENDLQTPHDIYRIKNRWQGAQNNNDTYSIEYFSRPRGFKVMPCDVSGVIKVPIQQRGKVTFSITQNNITVDPTWSFDCTHLATACVTALLVALYNKYA